MSQRHVVHHRLLDSKSRPNRYGTGEARRWGRRSKKAQREPLLPCGSVYPFNLALVLLLPSYARWRKKFNYLCIMMRFQRARDGVADIFRGSANAKTSSGSTRADPPVTLGSSLAPKPARRLGNVLALRRKPKPRSTLPETCLFLTALPPELREEVYLQLMQPLVPAVHVFERNGRIRNAPCISDHDVDDRQDLIERNRPKGVRETKYYKSPMWSRRLTNSWSNHWRCEEETHGEIAVINRIRLARRVLPLLLTCKSM